MKLMLDTSVFLRRLNDSPLPRSLDRLLTKQSTELVVSIVTGWEIVMKPKLKYSAADVEDAIEEMGAVLLPIKFRHLNEFSSVIAQT
jgi:PIN domain nuclease of toxin-antitoxin system